MSGAKKEPAIRRHGTRRWAFIASGVLLAGIAAYYTYDVLRARAETPRLFREALAADSVLLSPEDLSQAQLEALLAVQQDPQFFEHGGSNFLGGTRTTVTEGLAKYLFFERFRPGLATVRRSLIARFAIDPLVSKRDQLHLYINVLPLGFVGDNFVEGLAEGAEVYHSKPFDELTYDEFLSLLVFDRPMKLNPFADPEGNARRVRQIKRLLAGECRPPGLFNRTPNCWTEDPSEESPGAEWGVRPNEGLHQTRR